MPRQDSRGQTLGARELAALLKPAIDHINRQLDTILEQITALRETAAAPRPTSR